MSFRYYAEQDPVGEAIALQLEKQARQLRENQKFQDRIIRDRCLSLENERIENSHRLDMLFGKLR